MNITRTIIEEVKLAVEYFQFLQVSNVSDATHHAHRVTKPAVE
jgi:hypothetical protein